MLDWPSVYWYPKLKLLLMVYVDDFKMAGPAGNLEAGRKTITGGIKLVGIGLVPTYLGCDDATFEGTVDGKPVRGINDDMKPVMESCVDAYRKIVGKPGLHLPRVDTPFLGEDGGGNAPPPRSMCGNTVPTVRRGATYTIHSVVP